MTPERDTGDALASLEKKIDAIGRDIRALQRQMLWQRIWGMARAALIVVPLVWGLLIVYPLAQKFYGQFDAILKQANTVLNQTR